MVRKGCRLGQELPDPLGTAEVSPLAQAQRVRDFAKRRGRPHHVVREVRDRKGRSSYESQPEKKRASVRTSRTDVTFALSNVVKEGTGSAVQSLNRPVAARRGTKDRKNADDQRHRLCLVRGVHHNRSRPR